MQGYYANGSVVTAGSGFQFWPNMDIPAGSIFCDNPTSGQFGLSKSFVKKGMKGFADPSGVVRFDKPTGWTSVNGQKVYYTPSDQANGTFATTVGGVAVGFEVYPGTDVDSSWDMENFIYIELVRGI